MNGFEQTLWSELEATPVVDPHTHLTPEAPQAATLADIVLYHHVWIELVSAGMPATAATQAGLPHELADPGMPALDRIRAILPYLPAIRSTTCGNMLRVLLEDLYGVPGGQLTPANVEHLCAEAERKAQDPAWPSHVLRERCHIETSLTVHRPRGPARPGIEYGLEQSPILATGKRTPAQTLDDMEAAMGQELLTADDLDRALHALAKEHSRPPVRYLGLWLPGYFAWEHVAEARVSDVMARAREGRELAPPDLNAFTCFAVRSLLSGMLEGTVRTVQVIVGADVLPPHRSLTEWAPPFVGGLGRLAGEFEAVQFNCSTASDIYTQDLGVLAKHVPNVSVAGYWWHTLYPRYLRKSVETRLDMVPANKIVGFFSDAYHAEWCYPKLKLVKQIWGEVLLDRVDRGLLTADAALSLIRPVFCENARRIYGLA